MRTLALFRAVGPVDLKNVQRDSLLIWIPLLPLLLALLYRYGIPEVATLLDEQVGFRLEPFYPLLMSGFLLMGPAVAGMVIGFLLLDERDEQVLSALLVTPVPLDSYLAYRISAPVLLGTVMTLVSYPLAGLLPLPFTDLLVLALLASLSGPLLALFLASFAENKVAGFAMMKLINGVMLLPIAAYFLPGLWQWIAGLIPTYWSLKVFWLATEGASYWPHLLTGIAMHLLALALLRHRFTNVVHR